MRGAEIDALDQHRAAIGIVKTRQKAEEGRLATAVAADDRDHFVRFHRQGDIIECRGFRVVRVVGEADVAEFDEDVELFARDAHLGGDFFVARCAPQRSRQFGHAPLRSGPASSRGSHRGAGYPGWTGHGLRGRRPRRRASRRLHRPGSWCRRSKDGGLGPPSRPGRHTAGGVRESRVARRPSEGPRCGSCP